MYVQMRALLLQA